LSFIIDPWSDCNRLLRAATFALAFVVLLSMGAGPAEDRQGDVPDVTTPPALDQFIVVPLRIHLLTSNEASGLSCRLADGDIERIAAKVNGVWRPAGVYFSVESVVREPAASERAFMAACKETRDWPLHLLKMLRPAQSQTFEGLHVYYVHQLPVNGVYLGDGICFVQDAAKLREVAGGIDEPLPRVTSHELGHALGLPHRQNRTNLMASGTSGTLLNKNEVARARRGAESLAGASSVCELRQLAIDAERADDSAKALGIRKVLSAVSSGRESSGTP
jgi:hypothetical protein